jgi:hypothetical protein
MSYAQDGDLTVDNFVANDVGVNKRQLAQIVADRSAAMREIDQPVAGLKQRCNSQRSCECRRSQSEQTVTRLGARGRFNLPGAKLDKPVPYVFVRHPFACRNLSARLGDGAGVGTRVDLIKNGLGFGHENPPKLRPLYRILLTFSIVLLLSRCLVAEARH